MFLNKLVLCFKVFIFNVVGKFSFETKIFYVVILKFIFRGLVLCFRG